MLQNKNIQKIINSQSLLLHQQMKYQSLIITCAGTLVKKKKRRTQEKNHHGSVMNCLATLNWNYHQGFQKLFKDYLSENQVYPNHIFHQRFWMRQSLFLWIIDAVEAYNNYFVQKPNATGKLGISSLQRVTSTICRISHGNSADWKGWIPQNVSKRHLGRRPRLIQSYHHSYFQIPVHSISYPIGPWVNPGNIWTTRLPRNARITRLYELGVKKLPRCSAWAIFQVKRRNQRLYSSQ